MERAVRCAILLGCVLALTSAQNIFFDDGSSTPTDQCQLRGRPGACKEIVECPEHLSSLRARNLTALQAAVSNCGTKLVPNRSRPVQLLCCPRGSSPAPVVAPLVARRFDNHPQCGESQFAPGRIVGGEPVQRLKDFPWMAVLKWRPDAQKPEYRCGGAILNERWVLTAAHCIVNDEPVYVRVRDLDLATTTDDIFQSPPEDVPIERIIRHPDYRRSFRAPNRGLFNDIALIKLSRSLTFSDVSKPLCLPGVKRTTREYERIERSYIAGWGLTEFGGSASTVMQWAGVNISDHRTCQQSYQRTGIRVDDSEHLCANGNDLKQEGCVPGAEDGSCQGGVDACEGDSGGPLMERRDEFNRQRWYAIGVVSFGTGCGNPNFPGLFTRVDNFLDWIAETISAN